VLTPEQFTSFKAALEQEPVINIKTIGDQTNVETVRAVLINGLRRGNVTRLVEQYRLGESEKQQMKAALDLFKAHDRLIDGERAALLEQLRPLLSDQERDDLRAALERRPIVKQGALPGVSAALANTDATRFKVGITF